MFGLLTFKEGIAICFIFCCIWNLKLLCPQEAEDEVVKAAREAALRDLAKDDPNLLKRTIGPKLEKQPKKRQKYPVLPAIPFRPPPPEYYNRLVQNMVAVGVGDDLLWWFIYKQSAMENNLTNSSYVEWPTIWTDATWLHRLFFFFLLPSKQKI